MGAGPIAAEEASHWKPMEIERQENAGGRGEITLGRKRLAGFYCEWVKTQTILGAPVGGIAGLFSSLQFKSDTEVCMLKAAMLGCVFGGCLGSLVVAAPAQEVVHALTGTVSSIDSVSKTLNVFQDNGSQEEFKDMTGAKAHIQFDRKIALDTTSADAFKKSGAYVIVFYFGDDNNRTAVALKNLGAGPFTSTTGTVVKSEGKRSIAVQDGTGKVETYKITEQTVAEGYMGAVDGSKFQAQKGDHVRVVASTENGTATALFVRDN